MTTLHLLCAGAVKGLVLALAPGFAAQADGARIEAQFGAVGAMRDLLREGAPCDVLVVTAAMLAELEASAELAPGSPTHIGRVRTGIAVIEGAPAPDVSSADRLRDAVLASSALYFPDAARSTAGAHVARMLHALGIEAAMAPRCRMFANGATAMRALAESGDPRAIGCTQVTEIRYTAGLALVAALPPPFELSTVYGAAVAPAANDAALAQRFIAALTGHDASALRLAGGFEPAEVAAF